MSGVRRLVSRAPTPDELFVTPLEVHLKTLAAWGGLESGGRAVRRCGNRPQLDGLADFQIDGVRAVERSLRQYGGALLADSPGLGKTRMALAVAAELSIGPAGALMVVPASLRPMWERAARDAGVAGTVWTHERLASAREEPASSGFRLVIVDEAHRFRNASTLGYRRLARLCAGRRVLLISATPVNNKAEDLYHLLRLFAGDGSFRALGAGELREAFESPGRSATDGRRLLDAVMVRRDRRAIGNEYAGDRIGGSPIVFPRMRELSAGPFADGPPSGAFGELCERLHDESPRQGLVAFLLAKRLASSRRAFVRTLDRLLATPAPGAGSIGRRLLREMDDEGGVQGLIPFESGLPEGEQDAGPSREWLERLREIARGMENQPDPKIAGLERLLDRELRGRRTVVFTEYRDTAEAIYRVLRGRPAVAMLDGSGGRTAAGRCARSEVIERFAPIASGRGPVPAHEEVRLLVATDVLSEGLDLQDASCVVSFDLPWNPVRLTQRVGRLDRIGSRHEEVLAVTFPPDRRLDDLMRLLERLHAKRGIISRTVDERGTSSPSVESGASIPSLEAELARLLREAPLALARAARLPDGVLAVPRGARPGRDSMLVCGLLETPGAPPQLRWFLQRARGDLRSVEIPAALELARSLALEGFERSSGDADWRGRAGRMLARVARELMSRACGASGSLHPAIRRLTARIRRLEQDGWDDPVRLRAIETLESALSGPLSSGQEETLLDLARGREDGPALLERLSSLVERWATSSADRGVNASWRLLGAVVVPARLRGPAAPRLPDPLPGGAR